MPGRTVEALEFNRYEAPFSWVASHLFVGTRVSLKSDSTRRLRSPACRTHAPPSDDSCLLRPYRSVEAESAQCADGPPMRPALRSAAPRTTASR